MFPPSIVVDPSFISVAAPPTAIKSVSSLSEDNVPDVMSDAFKDPLIVAF